MNKIGNYIKEERKKAGLTQEEFAMRSGLGLRFVRELEQGKETVRMDKVNQALAMFGKEAVPGEKEEDPQLYIVWVEEFKEIHVHRFLDSSDCYLDKSVPYFCGE